MEQYLYANKNNNQTIHLGKYFNLVHEKHVISYGELGADNIVENIVETYKNIQLQLADVNASNNVLLVGKVQSGKTSNLELLTALAFDNGYNVLVIYGGYDKSLLGQTTERFKKTFNATGEITYDNDCPAVFTTDDSNQILSIDDEMMGDLLDNNKPVIFVSMKRPAAMRKINSLFKRIETDKIKAFIIDDEGDQASLNTAKDKKANASPTYAQIREMKSVLSDPMYLSVTATPQANIFLDQWSLLRPDSIRLIHPGKGYQGAEVYHLYENDIIETVLDDDQADFVSGSMPTSLWDSIRYFIVASAIKRKITDNKYSDMIIHSFREVNQHSVIYTAVDRLIQNMKTSFTNDSDDIKQYYKELEECFNKYVDIEIKEQISFDNIKEEIALVVARTYVILKNSAGKSTQGSESLKLHKIYIGGDLLQRGLTFKNLITTYFTRWAISGGNMDTNLQRARWFGYRNKYIHLCKIFTTCKIAREFTALAEIEDDLWDQFAEVENGILGIDDILIKADNTKQSPTSKTRVKYKKISFKNRWIKQKYIVMDKEQCLANNQHITQLIARTHWHNTTAGSNIGATTGKYATVSNVDLKQLITLIQSAFDQEPFQKKALIDLIGQDDVEVVLMSGAIENVSDLDKWRRYRSLYPQQNLIKALQQGPDTAEQTKLTYKGDSNVIVDENRINIQIHYIRPGYKNDRILDEFDQFMFAVYIPKQKVYFVKEENID